MFKGFKRRPSAKDVELETRLKSIEQHLKCVDTKLNRHLIGLVDPKMTREGYKKELQRLYDRAWECGGIDVCRSLLEDIKNLG